jgi:hypothetical protein
VGIVLLLALAFAPHSFLHGESDWQKVYLPASARLQLGDDLYQQAFVYPPLAAVLGLTSVHQPSWSIKIQFWLMNVAAGSLLIITSWRFSGGHFTWRPRGLDILIAGLGLGTALGFLLDVMVNKQIDLLVAALTISGGLLLPRGRGVLGGALVGLAAGLKCTPLILVPLAIVQGRFTAAMMIVVVAVGANLTVDLAYPPAGPPRLQEWTKRYLLPVGQSEPGRWYSANGYNHTLAGLFNRITRVERITIRGEVQEIPRDPLLSDPALKALVYGSGGLLMLLSMGVVYRVRHHNGTGRALPALAVCLMVLLSPMSSKPHFCVLIYPAWILARAAIISLRPDLLTLSLVALLLGLSANKDLVGPTIYSTLTWYGAIPIATLCLLLGNLLLLLRPNPPDRADLP